MPIQMVVGLGNPGIQYERTRHNVGFMVLDQMTDAWRRQFKADMGSCMVEGRKIWLCKPQTYMNLSGEAVSAAAKFYNIARQDVLVVTDDFALPLGRLRVRDKGSSGGHNGLTSIIEQMGGDDFPRLRIGIGPLPPRWDSKDFVLAPFAATEASLLNDVIKSAVEAVRRCVMDGVQKAQNQVNGIDLRPPEGDKASASV